LRSAIAHGVGHSPLHGIMILYWAWPTDGAGHAVRAAAICRWIDEDVQVIRGTNDPLINRSLDHFGVPYKVIESRRDAMRYAIEHPSRTLILDDRCGTVLDRKACLVIWRLGRPERLPRPIPMVRIEGPGSVGPVLMLEDDEILSKQEAREDLGLPQDKFLRIGIPSTSRPGLIENMQIDYLLDSWPALKWMRAADHIVSAIGANTYGEVNYLGLPATWASAPNARDQSVRICDLPKTPPTKNAARQIAKMISELKRP